MRSFVRKHPRVTHEAGFTMIELLVSMTLSIVVVGAAYLILDVALHQTALITDKTQANQLGRTVLTNIEDELHSSCTGFKTPSIQAPVAGSAAGTREGLGEAGATNLWFMSAYGKEEAGHAVIKKAALHDITWTKTGFSKTTPVKELGTLTDYSFPATYAGISTSGGVEWTLPVLKTANATVRQLATNIIPASGPTIFQYYTYNPETIGGKAGEIETSAMAGAPSAEETLSTGEANANYIGNIAEVSITFAQAPNDSDTRLSREAHFSDSVVLRFSPVTSGSGALNGPCP